MAPIFDIAKCPVIPLDPIDLNPFISDCSIPGAPTGIFECPDPAVPLPLPAVPASGSAGPPGAPGSDGPDGGPGIGGATGPAGPPGANAALDFICCWYTWCAPGQWEQVVGTGTCDGDTLEPPVNGDYFGQTKLVCPCLSLSSESLSSSCCPPCATLNLAIDTVTTCPHDALINGDFGRVLQFIGPAGGYERCWRAILCYVCNERGYWEYIDSSCSQSSYPDGLGQVYCPQTLHEIIFCCDFNGTPNPPGQPSDRGVVGRLFVDGVEQATADLFVCDGAGGGIQAHFLGRNLGDGCGITGDFIIAGPCID